MSNFMCDNIRVLALWEGVLKRPIMYIGKKSIYGLRCFITGMRMIDPYAFDLDGFEEWHRTQFAAIKISFEFALAMSNNDDEKAFELWAEWYTEFKRIENKGVAE